MSAAGYSTTLCPFVITLAKTLYYFSKEHDMFEYAATETEI